MNTTRMNLLFLIRRDAFQRQWSLTSIKLVKTISVGRLNIKTSSKNMPLQGKDFTTCAAFYPSYPFCTSFHMLSDDLYIYIHIFLLCKLIEQCHLY